MKSPLNSHRPRISRRAVLKGLSFAPLALRPAPILGSWIAKGRLYSPDSFSLADVHLSPHYPSQSPLADIFRLVTPGSDDYPLEKDAIEIESILNKWGASLKESP